MGRLLLCLVVFLPLCLALQDQRSSPESGSTAARSTGDAPAARTVSALQGVELLRAHCLASLASQSQASFPGTLAWSSLHHVCDQGFEHLFQERPWEFLQMCLDRYEREVRGYTTMFRKRERIDGKLHDEEIVECFFKEEPFSILMVWHKGWRRAKKALYVQGENNNKMLALPAPPFGFFVVSRDVDGEDAKKSGRYFINGFGVNIGAQRTVKHMLEARERDKLQVDYLGITEVPELGDRPCYTFVRTKYDPPEEDGVAELTIYIDMETWLQAGSVLKDSKGDLIAEYFFRDIKLNPQFAADQFTRKKL